MLLHTDDRPITPGDLIQDETEALIREARRRTRRRRARRVVALAVLTGIGLAVSAVVGGGSGGVVAATATHPYANLRAFKGQGELAFISRGQGWVIDGGRGTLRRLPAPGGDTPSSPVFSHDGRWLAYVAAPSQDSDGPSELWIAHADGTGAHRVRDLAVNRFVGWSPGADLIAVGAGESTRVPYDSPTAVDLVSPDGRARALLARSGQRPMVISGGIWSVVWSPNGRSLAVSTYSPERDAGMQILNVPVAPGARPTVWLSIRSAQRLTGALSCGRSCVAESAIADLAGWWPKWGIAFWVFTSGMTHNSDSTPLAVIARPDAKPRVVAQTLSDGTTDAADAGPGGELALVASSNSAGREYTTGKTVEQCSPFSCTAPPHASTWTGRPLKCRPCFGAPAAGPGSAVSLDPAWSPDGTLVAYTKAPAYRAGGNPTLAWFQAHQLDVWNARTDTTHRIGAISGSSLPTWSGDGKKLLYVSADGLWLANAVTGKAVEIEHPLYRQSTWKHVADTNLAFYGQIPWSKQFSWHTSSSGDSRHG
jgi:hypothetical protein